MDRNHSYNDKSIQLIDIKSPNRKGNNHISQSLGIPTNIPLSYSHTQLESQSTKPSRISYLKTVLILITILIISLYLIKTCEISQLKSSLKASQYINQDLLTRKAQLTKRNAQLSNYFEEVTIQYNEFKDEKTFKRQMLHQILHPYTSDIIQSIEELMELRKLVSYEGKVGLRLVYQVTEGKDTAKEFHSHTDALDNLLILIQSTGGERFGGFTKLNFKPRDYADFSEGIDKEDEEGFLFHFDKRTRWMLSAIKKKLYCDEDFGPIFGDDLKLMPPFLKNEQLSQLPQYYDVEALDRFSMNKELSYTYKVRYMEVYQVFFSQKKVEK